MQVVNSNTTMTAPNTFTKGLVMDFNPTITKNDTLTNALNATLLTFNGNEMQLQNDMGNGRVETAFLPEGYVPIGTCEFGDIIYILSYNPLEDKSQLGCFPSPERNISSEELGGLKQNISSADFQELDNNGNPTGVIKATNIKKVLYDNNYMNSGDKYIIYANVGNAGGNLESFSKYLSDFGNTEHIHGKFPKLVKIHVVSVEDSGKIVKLDSTVKWYKDTRLTGKDSDYYIFTNKYPVTNNTAQKVDLDEYRTKVSSAYSIFSSKISGKLALLIELETIDSFSCSYEIYTEDLNTKESPVENLGNYKIEVPNSNGENVTADMSITLQKKKYNIYWDFSWHSENKNINPSHAVLLTSEWSSTEAEHAGEYIQTIYNVANKKFITSEYKKVADALPKGFNTNKTDYWYSKFDRSYKPEDYTAYKDFIETKSYDAIEKDFVDKYEETFKKFPYKLNYIRDSKTGKPNDGKDVKQYVINCTSVIKKNNVYTYYTLNNKGVEMVTDPVYLADDIVNNYFYKPVYKKFTDFTLPYKETATIKYKDGEKDITTERDLTLNKKNLIYHYSVAPAMPYGILDYLSQEGYIDFSKVGTGSIDLNIWKYYNYENTCTLQWGLEAYPEDNMGIAEVVFEFYDNQGLAAAFHSVDKNSYSGTFTESLPLNGLISNKNMNNVDADGNTFLHAGTEVSYMEARKNSTFRYCNTTTKNGMDIESKSLKSGLNQDNYNYIDDAGTLYSNVVYYVRITMKYCTKTALDEYDTTNKSRFKYFEKWLWTNTMFNEYYYNTNDFADLQASLNLDTVAVYQSNDNYVLQNKTLAAPGDSSGEISYRKNNLYKSLSANVQYCNMGSNTINNVDMAVRVGLENDYNTFNINQEAVDAGNIDLTIYYGKDYYVNSPEQPQAKASKELPYQIFDGLYPIFDTSRPKTDALKEMSSSFNTIIESGITGSNSELWTDENSYKKYINYCRISDTEAGLTTEDTDLTNKLLEYLDSNGNVVELEAGKYEVRKANLKDCQFSETNKKIIGNKKINLGLSLLHFSKYYYENTKNTKSAHILRSVVLDEDDASNAYKIKFNGNTPYCTMTWGDSVFWGKSGDNRSLYRVAIRYFNSPTESIVLYHNQGHSSENPENLSNKRNEADRSIPKGIRATLNEFIVEKNPIIDTLPFIMPHTAATFTSSSWSYIRGMQLCYGQVTSFFLDASPFQWDPLPMYLKDVEASTLNGDRYSKESTVTFRDSDLGGSIFIFTDNTKSGYVTNGWIVKENALVWVAKFMLALLGQLYYLDENSSAIPDFWIPNNLIFLNDNISTYTRDIIIKPKIENKNNLLLMHGLSYSRYLEKLKTHYIKPEALDLTDNNVNIQINSVLKNCPITINCTYITPDTNILVTDGSYTVVRSSINGAPSSTNQSLAANTLYRYDGNNFVPFNRNYRRMPAFKSVAKEDDTSLKIDVDNNYYMDLSAIGGNLYLKDGVVKCSQVNIVQPSYDYGYRCSNYAGTELNAGIIIRGAVHKNN